MSHHNCLSSYTETGSIPMQLFAPLLFLPLRPLPCISLERPSLHNCVLLSFHMQPSNPGYQFQRSSYISAILQSLLDGFTWQHQLILWQTHTRVFTADLSCSSPFVPWVFHLLTQLHIVHSTQYCRVTTLLVSGTFDVLLRAILSHPVQPLQGHSTMFPLTLLDLQPTMQ